MKRIKAFRRAIMRPVIDPVLTLLYRLRSRSFKWGYRREAEAAAYREKLERITKFLARL